MTSNKPMTGELLDELMAVAVNMQRDSEKAGDLPISMFAYAVQVAVMELRYVRELKSADENNVAAMNSITAIIAILGSSDTLGISAQVAELKAQRDALAAENAGLKAAIVEHSQCFTVCKCCGTEHDCSHDDVCRAVSEVPETDSFLSELRAATIETCADDLVSKNDIGGYEIDAMYVYAENLRKGAQL